MKAILRLLMSNLMMMLSNPHLTAQEKVDNAHHMNRRAGGALFSSSPIPAKTLNQRQRRKRYRQSGHPKLRSRRSAKA